MIGTDVDGPNLALAAAAVYPAQSWPEIESVVSRTDRFEVVRKRGIAGAVAEQLDTSGELQPG